MQTTGIGSLPHHNVDSALDYSFRHDLPFLPQLPSKNAKELMVYQTLFGFPGLALKNDKPILILKNYVKERPVKMELLKKALSTNNFEAFYPTPSEYACFAPFLFELEERNCKQAKVQVAGHLTSSVTLTLEDGESLTEYSGILQDILEWTTVKGLALISALTKKGVSPVIFIDEPILTLFKPKEAQFISGMQAISMMALFFKKAQAKVGLHSCGNTDWGQILKLPLDYLSFDLLLSGKDVLKEQTAVTQFIQSGGNFALGLLPTQMFDEPKMTVDLAKLVSDWKAYEAHALVSCACGLGLKTPEKAERFLSLLKTYKDPVTV